ncbi:MAG: ATP-binding protein [Nitrospirota bacterium]
MRLSIFSRLVIGYLAVFILVMAVSVYAVVQLRHFNRTIRSILEVNNLLADYEKRLSDSLFSQIRYERKYIIIKDSALYDQFLSTAGDFARSCDAALAVADTPQKKILIRAIRDRHAGYRALVQQEAELVRRNSSYPQLWYKEEKQRKVEAITEELRKLKSVYQQHTYERIKELRASGDAAAGVVAAMALTSLTIGIGVAFVITRSITRPLSVVVDKTREIAKGNLKSDLAVASPPEIGELSRAFNSMCKKLSMLDKMKSDFFSYMSHELRTPLASIKEGTNLLLEGVGGEANERQKRLLTIIAEESNRMIGMVNSIMDLSKMEAGMMTYDFAPADIAPLIRKAAEEAELLAGAKQITLTVEPLPALPEIRLDRERIMQVLRNLIGNAVKFTPYGGEITVSAGLVAGSIMVVVSDSGPGIEQENLPVIFEKFQQAPTADTGQIKGTGLGLAIVKHIITAHGGRVWAESTPGQGSSFIFVLPVS